jgi:hypothetical protein
MNSTPNLLQFFYFNKNFKRNTGSADILKKAYLPTAVLALAAETQRTCWSREFSEPKFHLTGSGSLPCPRSPNTSW